MTDSVAAERMRGVSWCATAHHLGWLGLTTLLLPLPGMFAVGMSAATIAILAGFSGLWRVRSEERWGDCETAHERVAFKATKRARRQGAIGLIVGMVGLGIWISIFVG